MKEGVSGRKVHRGGWSNPLEELFNSEIGCWHWRFWRTEGGIPQVKRKAFKKLKMI